MALHPYKIEIANPILDDLRERLTRTRLPETDERGWRDGTDLTYLSKNWSPTGESSSTGALRSVNSIALTSSAATSKARRFI